VGHPQPSGNRRNRCIDRDCLWVSGNFRPGDAVLLLGKGHERCIIYGSERRPWDESAEALSALAELGYRNEGE